MGNGACLAKKAIHVRACQPLMQRSEEHTSELQSQSNLVCRLLLEKKKKTNCSRSILDPSDARFASANVTRSSPGNRVSPVTTGSCKRVTSSSDETSSTQLCDCHIG